LTFDLEKRTKVPVLSEERARKLSKMENQIGVVLDIIAKTKEKETKLELEVEFAIVVVEV